ncbi:MAG: bifunctional ADP-heptose synthase [Chloroflexota bacterium]|nr:bifunctional ADP-heptose synthase [Chloroflexota bacterium]
MHYQDLLKQFRERTVVVVGDVCLDRYILGRPTRLSREAPIAVLEWSREYSLPGAASNPALNLVSLGARASVVGVTGVDSAAQELSDLLLARGAMTDGLVADPARRTTEKTRILAEGLLVLPQQMARIDRTDPSPLMAEREEDLCAMIRQLAPQADALLLSDYQGGVASATVIACVWEAARERGILTTVDSQGDLARFAGLDCVRCNRHEAEAVLGHSLTTEEAFRSALPELQKRVGCGILVITRDAEGVSFYSAEDGYGYIPSVPVPVADGVGAGDTFISVLTLVLASGGSLGRAAHVANRAAALVVQHVGNAYPSPEELLQILEADA